MDNRCSPTRGSEVIKLAKKKRPLIRGLGPGLDPAFLNNNCNDFKCLVEGDPGIEPGIFSSRALLSQNHSGGKELKRAW